MNSIFTHAKKQGFTIVELMVVIVVIAILASITIVTYTGIQNRGHDTAVQSDLRHLASQLELYRSREGKYPAGSAELSSSILELRVTKNSYSTGSLQPNMNVLYCRVAANPQKFAILAQSKSNKIFMYKSETGAITEVPTWVSTSSQSVCRNTADVLQADGNDRDFFYWGATGGWQDYIRS